MHQRHSISSPQKESSLWNGTKNGESTSVSPSIKNQVHKRRRRRRRQQVGITKLLIVRTLLITGVCGLALVLLLMFENVRSTSTATFLLYSEQAPQCQPILSPDDVDFTLVTQLSEDRLWMMEHHCSRYPHPMSIAVYTNQTEERTLNQLTSYGCDLSILAVSVVDASRVGCFDDYPVNLLRNTALSEVRTSYIIYIDVDFWTSSNLYETLSSPNVKKELILDPHLALVIPAFMLFRHCRDYIDCRNLNIPAMPFTKEDVTKMIVHEEGHIFDPTNKGGHGSTRYKDWMHQNEGTLLEIECVQSHRYEPFVAIRYCRDLPPFQPAFSGYGKNKMTWMMHVVRRGYRMNQVGGSFLVHYPHLDSPSRTKWNEAPDQLKYNQDKAFYQIRRPKPSDGHLNLDTYKRGQVDGIFVAFREWLMKVVPDESRVKMCNTAQDDDSKLWIEKDTSFNVAKKE